MCHKELGGSDRGCGWDAKKMDGGAVVHRKDECDPDGVVFPENALQVPPATQRKGIQARSLVARYVRLVCPRTCSPGCADTCS